MKFDINNNYMLLYFFWPCYVPAKGGPVSGAVPSHAIGTNMIKNFASSFLMIAIYTVVTLVLGFSIDPPTEKSSQQSEQNYSHPKYQPSLSVVLDRGIALEGEFIHTHHEEVLAAATVFIAIYTIILALATKAMVKEGRGTAERQLRAYIGIDGIETEFPNLFDENYTIPEPVPIGFVFSNSFVFRITNYGKTPASQVDITMNWQPTNVGTRLDESTFPFGDLGDTGESVYYLAPGKTEFVYVVLRKTEYIRVFRKAHDLQVSVTCYGHVNYRDVFGKLWRQDFCFLYEPWRSKGGHFTPYGPRNREREVSE